MKQPELGKKILELRQARGLTQSELADSCNLSLRTIQRIESGETDPRNYTSKAILACLGYDWGELSKSPVEPKPEKVKSKFRWAILLVFALFVAGATFAGLRLFRTETVSDPIPIEDWDQRGENYRAGRDTITFKMSGNSASLESIKRKVEKGESGTLTQSCSAMDYQGKRIRLSAYIKSNRVKGWAGMLLRVDDKDTDKALALDDMSDRPIRGTANWTRCEIVLDVPEGGSTLTYGISLTGTGKIWFDDVKLEIVDNDIPTTSRHSVKPGPTNLDFSR